jgi:hypothetical protein
MGFWWCNLRERGHLEDLGVDGRAVLDGTFRNSVGVLDWIDLFQDRDRRQALENTVKKLRGP